ncbi:tissue factor-like [Myxocyprinus asiaticus]|uniref:tissue factor-like n=1 Tax=Myxocyprinus asiaticus TaxID=70543 RepID=UPI0022223DCB|nr:tissue factor-like [Myxocyprinus asiaticus]
MESKTIMFSALFLAWLAHVNGSPASVKVDQLPKATNLTWSSYNFKTILTWGPEPVNYTYTVEFSRVGGNAQRNPHCIKSSEAECDLTNELLELKGVYSAVVVSEPLPGMTTSQDEPPFTRSKTFCPYNETLIGRPEFKIVVREDKSITLLIIDPITALHKNGRSLNIRDIFKKNLKYKVSYHKAGSTGEKIEIAERSKVEFKALDVDQSYCFSVAAYIPSRKGDKSVGVWSLPKCSPGVNKSVFEEYGLPVIGAAALIILVFLIGVILIVLCCKRTQKQTLMAKEELV